MTASVSLRHILIICVLVGTISGLGATLFFAGVEFGSDLLLKQLAGFMYPWEGDSLAQASQWAPPHTIWLILPILLAGALVSGLIVWKFAPETEGHGTDAALKSYHENSKIRWRVPLVKAISSILTISSGGSAGCEGPIAQISAGFGSIISDICKFTGEERRLAIVIGIGAGVGAIFKAPIGGALLAAEILYLRDCRPAVFFPALLASGIGYAIFGAFFGYRPLFATISMDWSALQLPLFVVLGLLAAAIGFLYIKSFYGSKKLFDRLEHRFRIPKFLKPVIGAGIMGLLIIGLSYLAPETLIAAVGCLGTGYGFVQLTLFNLLPFAALLILPFLKIICTSLTIGSGASGGVFAPGISVGAFTGAALAMGLHLLFPEYVPLAAVPLFAIVGMIALFGGISHAPFAMLIMVIEMTGSVTVLIPAAIAVALACLLLRTCTIFKQQRVSETDGRVAGDLPANR